MSRIRVVVLVLLVLVGACRRSTAVAPDPPVIAPPVAVDAAPPVAVDAGPPAPDVALGPAWRPLDVPTHGRFASVVQWTFDGTDGAVRSREDDAASFVLELAPDGTATACRGWRYAVSRRGPDVDSAYHFNEQQGYRGTHVAGPDLVEITLHTDDDVCPHRFESTVLLPRSPKVTLHCVRAAPVGPAPTAPALLCQWIELRTFEAQGLIAPDVAPEGWMVLGTGNGLRIAVSGPFRGDAANRTVVSPAPAPLGHDAWERSF